MMLQLNRIKTALTSITLANGYSQDLRVYHYWRPRLEAPFCIWAEDGEGDSLHTNNHKSEQVITGTIDYFTKQDLDPTVDDIQSVLNEIECFGWSLSSVDYEEDTNLIHYTWSFEIV